MRDTLENPTSIRVALRYILCQKNIRHSLVGSLFESEVYFAVYSAMSSLLGSPGWGGSCLFTVLSGLGFSFFSWRGGGGLPGIWAGVILLDLGGLDLGDLNVR